jgi:hypothetical protein
MNSFVIWDDSTRLDSTSTVIMKAVWQDNFANKAILIECRDDSAANYAGDSACAKIGVLQLFPFTASSGVQYFAALNSRANPDSTTKYGSSVFNLFDSLDIHAMDTGAAYTRNKISAAISGGAGGYYPGDSLLVKTVNTKRAFAYIALPFDFSPAFAIKLTGLASNCKRGPGSMWKIRVFGLRGSMVRAGN